MVSEEAVALLRCYTSCSLMHDRTLAATQHVNSRQRLTIQHKEVVHKSCPGYSRNSDAGGKGKA